MNIVLRKCEDIKGVTRSRKWEDRQYNVQNKQIKTNKTKGQTMISIFSII